MKNQRNHSPCHKFTNPIFSAWACWINPSSKLYENRKNFGRLLGSFEIIMRLIWRKVRAISVSKYSHDCRGKKIRFSYGENKIYKLHFPRINRSVPEVCRINNCSGESRFCGYILLLSCLSNLRKRNDLGSRKKAWTSQRLTWQS